MARLPFPRGGIRARLPVTIYRRSSDEFSPTEISGLALWLDASDSSTLFQNSDGTVPATATSDPVGYWGDKSGNGRHLTQAISGSRPSLLPTGISSKPALNFDGTDDNIWRQPGLTSDDLSILTVHQSNALGGGITYEFTHSGDVTNSQAVNATGFVNVAGLQVAASGSPAYMSDVQRSFANVDIQGRSGTAGDIAANVPVLSTQCVSYSATASAIRKQAWTSGNGMLNSGRFNCGGWSAVTLGARRNNLAAGGINSPTVFLSGRIAEVITYSRYITDTERRKLELYLARKYSVTLTGAPIVSNAEAQDWIDRVYGNGGGVSAATAGAVNQFCLDIENAPGGSIRDKFFRVNLFAGSNLNAALTPLYLGPTPLGIRYGNATDTNVGGLFVTANYNETGATGGLAGNGSNKYLNTGFPTNTLSASDRHLAAYPITWPNGGYQYFLGSESAAGASQQQFALGHFDNANKGEFAFGPNAGAGYLSSTTAISSGGMWIGVNTSGSGTIYRNGVANGTLSLTAATPTASEIFAFAANRASTPGAANYFNGRIGGYSIGLSMTAAQAAAYNTAMQSFQTALTRNV